MFPSLLSWQLFKMEGWQIENPSWETMAKGAPAATHGKVLADFAFEQPGRGPLLASMLQLLAGGGLQHAKASQPILARRTHPALDHARTCAKLLMEGKAFGIYNMHPWRIHWEPSIGDKPATKLISHKGNMSGDHEFYKPSSSFPIV